MLKQDAKQLTVYIAWLSAVCRRTCEPAGLRQQESAPGHEEEESRLQQGEVPQLRELGHVNKIESQGAKTKRRHIHRQPAALTSKHRKTSHTSFSGLNKTRRCLYTCSNSPRAAVLDSVVSFCHCLGTEMCMM